MSDDLFVRAIAWRNGDKTGRSSVALVSHLMGWPNGGTDFPCDSGDFGRCENAIAEIGLRDRIGKAREISLQWGALVENWTELEDLYKHGRNHELYRRIRALVWVFCPRGCGELKWESEREAVCSTCGNRVGMRDPRLPEPEPEKPKGVRENLIAGYLLLNENGDVIGETDDCEKCDGEGTVECVCDECDDEHTKDCEQCDGSGSRPVTWDFEHEPDFEEGQTAIIAIFDKRNISGPRIGCENQAEAAHKLAILLEQPDNVINSMFTERRAA